TLLGSGAYALYQVIRLALGERWSAGQTSDLIAAASAAAVTGLLLTYHLRVFRRDTTAPPGPAGPPAAEPAGLLPATAPVLVVAFIRAPDRAALDAFRHTLSARLPDDLEVETREVDAETAARLRRDLAP
ncbi:MAG TPA: hypothetical protein VHL09_16205, partial [Dehalococcoidia bacterium]|nr:hypothetical protein [Dehalococcoidia bacterium]